MDAESRSSWLRSAKSPGVLLLALIVFLGVGGYLLTSATIRRDRDEAAARRARVEAVHTQEVLGRARAYVDGLAEVLAQEPEPGQARFARWAGATSASVGLNDVLWVERVAASERRRYERLRGVRITRLTASGRAARAPAARSYLPATYTSESRTELRPGIDVTGFPALAAAIRDRARIFAVGASRPGALGGEPGFYLLEAATFARGRASRGYLVAFVPRGWFSTTLGGDPRRFAISEDRQRIEGQLNSVQASAGFEMLGRDWRIDVSREPLSGLQSILPWLALAWPFAVAVIAFLVGRAITRRRRLETDVERLAGEQAALRRVATLVAREASQAEVFTAIAEEIRQLFEGSLIYMFRYEDDHAVVAVASAGVAEGVFPVRSRHELGGKNAATSVFHSGEPVRIDDYATASGPIAEAVRPTNTRAVVGTPLVIDGRLWGVMVMGTTREERLPPETELRLGQFTELMATAIANTESRARADRLANEQGALRRVATLVAEGAQPSAVFDAVAGEMEALLDADQVALNRFEPSDEILVLAHRGLDVARTPVGSRLSIEGESVTAMVRRTGQPARMESYAGARGALAQIARETGLRSSVSAPIVVEGRVWGLITASWKSEQSPPAETEQRMAQFAQLLDTAIANAEARAELMASRARLVTASDEARRRFERDLHDGLQQRLVSLSLELRGAEAMATSENTDLVEQVSHVGKGLAEALDDLRELSRGIHPAILSEGGLVPALKALARRSSVPVELDLAVDERLADQMEVGAYYVVSEALANAAKHARASKVKVHVGARNGVLELTIEDDGVGGADASRGSGLTGLADRVEALGGTIAIASPPGEGTALRVELSLDGQ